MHRDFMWSTKDKGICGSEQLVLEREVLCVVFCLESLDLCYSWIKHSY
jgi:hypothetical protein